MQLKNLYLIDVSEIDARIDELEKWITLHQGTSHAFVKGQIDSLKHLKSKLIPADKLASIAFDAGANGLQEALSVNNHYDDDTFKEEKETFLKSDIRIS